MMGSPIPGDLFTGGRYSSIHFDVNKERANLGLHIYA
jgi:hypothetical protein